MRVVVCVRPSGDARRPVLESDAVAAEAALQVAGQVAGQVAARVTAVALGVEDARAALRHVLAMGADDGVLLLDAVDDDRGAAAVAATVRAIDGADVVCCGLAGDLGLAVAATLGWPVVTARTVEVTPRGLRVHRAAAADRLDTVEVRLPAVVLVEPEYGNPRIPRPPHLTAAAKKPVVERSV